LTASKFWQPGTAFRHILIVESRTTWLAFQAFFDPLQDLVLTYDFALRRQIEGEGGMALYVDHLADPSFMQANNFLAYHFFRDWHLDAHGADIFRYRGVDFGFSFRIEIWNDFTFYMRSRLCLEQLRRSVWHSLYLDSELPLLREVLEDMGIPYAVPEPSAPTEATFRGYFFPIHRWMHERLRAKSPRNVLRDVVVAVQGLVMSVLGRLMGKGSKAGVFVQEYHPTRQLLQCLLNDPGLRVVQAHFSSRPGLARFFRERPIPVYGRLKRYQADADRLLLSFRQGRAARLLLAGGLDITNAAYRVIERKVAEVLPQSLRALRCTINYLDRHPLRLEILIANVGQLAMLVDCVAKSRGVPSYMIINGLLGNAYLDEGKYATVINAYSTSIRDNYFRGMDNVVCLGDPRMDAYANTPPKKIDRIRPTVTIGASGFNHIDLNSFSAVEFEFLYEVLSAIRNLGTLAPAFRVLLKVRPNGYSELYRQFTAEYFPGMVDLVIDNEPMRKVLDESDLFISIYSQTLFEASCLGIPVIYHKTDCEIMDPPFDGRSELVTTHDTASLETAILDFVSASDRFDAFLEKQVMEKYVGPLDGRNLERNINFVSDLLRPKRAKCSP
jgi:hypothetical protein